MFGLEFALYFGGNFLPSLISANTELHFRAPFCNSVRQKAVSIVSLYR
jgi:hypothetical protein